jgi:hypothetical protein
MLRSAKTFKLANPYGFTLMEMMVGVGIGSFGIFLFSTAIIQIRNLSNQVEYSAARSELASIIRKAILDRRALSQTVENNPVVKAIVKNDFTGAVSSVNSGEPYGINVYDASGNKIAGAAADSTHPTASPVYYTMDGLPCPELRVGRCFISVTASFLIQGHPQWGTHHGVEPTPTYPAWSPSLRPDFMQIHYMIVYDEQAPGIFRKPIEGTVFIGFDDLGI